MRYPNHLRQQREAKGATQWDVCKSVDIHPNRYGRMEKGQTQPSYAEGVRLGAYFGVAPDALFPPAAVTQANPAA